MSHQQTHRLANLSSVKLALLAKQAYAQVEDVLHAEPIAVIGMGCRFPGGAANPAAYWELLRNGVDATGEVPPDRWDADAWCAEDFAAPGKTNTRRGGFLRQIDGFDAAFFGIAPREAERMDPQQRLMLEVAFEALDEGLMLRQLPGVFCAGEMLDWEAPTGGYLLTACFASGRAAARGLACWLQQQAD